MRPDGAAVPTGELATGQERQEKQRCLDMLSERGFSQKREFRCESADHELKRKGGRGRMLPVHLINAISGGQSLAGQWR